MKRNWGVRRSPECPGISPLDNRGRLGFNPSMNNSNNNNNNESNNCSSSSTVVVIVIHCNSNGNGSVNRVHGQLSGGTFSQFQSEGL